MGLKAAFKEGGEAFNIFLGILFGAVLMSFIFGFLGPTQAGINSTNPSYNQTLANQANAQSSINAFTGNASAVGYILVTFLVLAALIGLYAMYKKSSQGNEGRSRRPSWGSQASYG